MTSTEVPLPYEVALDGHPFVRDAASDQHRHRSTPLQRTQADDSDEPGEQSLDRSGPWRKSQSTWIGGAGQTHLDRADSEPNRYRNSFRVNPWTPWELSLLNATSSKLTSSGVQTKVLQVQSYVYVRDGTALKFTSSLTGSPTWTTVTGVGNIVDFASDGNTVYTTDGSNVYSAVVGASSGSSYNTLDCTKIDYVKGRLMAANANSIYNITSGTPPAALYTHPNASAVWAGFAGGPGHIYAATETAIYKTAIEPDGTALGVPQQAGELPRGETIAAIYGYLNQFLFIGVSVGNSGGVRMALFDANGDLQVGALIPTPNRVASFEGQDKFVWFGLTNYTSEAGTAYTGLGRLDPTIISESGAPAWAPDLMAATSGAITSIATFQGKRVFVVDSVALHAEGSTAAANGYLETGYVSYGLADEKILTNLNVRHEPLVGTIAGAVSVDAGAYTTLGTSSTAASVGAEFAAETDGELFEFKFTLTAGASSPTLTRWTSEALPVVAAGTEIIVPLLLTDHPDAPSQIVTPARTPAEELLFIEGLRDSRSVVTYQEGSLSRNVTVEDYEWFPHTYVAQSNGTAYFNGTCVVRMREL